MSIESAMLCNHLFLCCPHFLLPSVFPSIRIFFHWIGSSYQVAKVSGASASASILLMNIQGWFPLGLTGFISLKSNGLFKGSPALQFRSINSSLLSLLYGPILTSIHDYWKNHSFDYADLCWQSDISAFFHIPSRFVIAYPPRRKHLLIWVTICSDFGDQENEIYHSFHFFRIYLPWSDGTGCHDLVLLLFFNAEFQAGFSTLLFCPHQVAL